MQMEVRRVSRDTRGGKVIVLEARKFPPGTTEDEGELREAARAWSFTRHQVGFVVGALRCTRMERCTDGSNLLPPLLVLMVTVCSCLN